MPTAQSRRAKSARSAPKARTKKGYWRRKFGVPTNTPPPGAWWIGQKKRKTPPHLRVKNLTRRGVRVLPTIQEAKIETPPPPVKHLPTAVQKMMNADEHPVDIAERIIHMDGLTMAEKEAYIRHVLRQYTPGRMEARTRARSRSAKPGLLSGLVKASKKLFAWTK